MKFSVQDFFAANFLKKSIMENFIFCAVTVVFGAVMIIKL